MIYCTGSHIHDHKLEMLDMEEEWENEKREEAERDCLALYRRWHNMTMRQRWDELSNNHLLIEVHSETHVYAHWQDEFYQDEFPLDDPIGTFEEVENGLHVEVAA